MSAAREVDTTRSRRETVLARSVADPSELPDASTQGLLDLLGAGRTEAGDELARRFAPKLERFVRYCRRVRSASGMPTQDVVQSAYRRWLTEPDAFRYRGRGSLYAYLKTLAFNRLRAAERDPFETRAIATPAAEQTIERQDGRELAPDEATEVAELEKILDESLETLPEREREILAQRRMLHGTWKELAEALGYTSAHAAETQYYRAKIAWLERAGPRLKAWRESQ